MPIELHSGPEELPVRMLEKLQQQYTGAQHEEVRVRKQIVKLAVELVLQLVMIKYT